MMRRLSPVARRRFERFRNNRRGWWSLWLFCGLFVISLCGELIANDKPLVLSYQHELYFPAFKRYTEVEFGGQLPFQPDYRSDYVRELITKGDGWMLFPPIPFSDDTPNYDLNKPAPSPPSEINWLGTDDQARDVLARVIFGSRVSILFALALTVISALIGIAAGALQGYYGGWVDLIGQRLLEVWSGLPVLYLLIILSGFVEPNFWWLLGIMALFSWLALVDVVRAEFLRGRNLEYVKAARALGLDDRKVIMRHILPNAMNATLSYLPFILTGAISTLTALDFLGFGMPAGSASLGELIGQGKQNLQAPWLGFTAFFTLALILSLLVFIGEALRDAFDPRS
jgi:microcin C transport system permease protein